MLNRKDKKAIESETLIKIVLWIIFAAIIALAIKALLKKFGILS